MDKLRALHYFLAAAETGSLSAAARSLGVSLAAVAKLVSALERDVGVALFDRTPRGLDLTVDGQAYLEACRPAVEQIAAASDLVRLAKDRPRGTVVLGAPPQLARHCLLPVLAEFHARYPEIEIDLRTVGRMADTGAKGVEVFVLLGWLPPHDFVSRRLATSGSALCASAAYWAEHGQPRTPQDLQRHLCLPYRNPDGVLLDHWRFKRGDTVEAVTVHGWLTSTDREALLNVVLGGGGVMRLSKVTVLEHLRSGRLVSALTDWELLDNPPINLLYRANHRRIPRLRAFVDFIATTFAELEAAANGGPAIARMAEAPRWHNRSTLRASTMFRPEA
jgi:DNA-binding transcriptional LysR family regulator